MWSKTLKRKSKGMFGEDLTQAFQNSAFLICGRLRGLEVVLSSLVAALLKEQEIIYPLFYIYKRRLLFFF
jgi:hypothetical protein